MSSYKIRASTLAIALLFGLGCGASFTNLRPGVACNIYVSPEGSDRFTGALAEANATKTDGPLATPRAARDAAIEQLYVNGVRRPRARLPKKGYYQIAADAAPTSAAGGKGHDRFAYANDDISATWADLGRIEVVAFHLWTTSRLRIAGVDAASRIVTFTGPTSSSQYWAALAKGNRYYIDNVREALWDPGEWSFDPGAREITYIPLPGEVRETAEAAAPRLETLVAFEGDIQQKRWVENITFEEIAFAHAAFVTPPTGHSFPQAEISAGASAPRESPSGSGSLITIKLLIIKSATFITRESPPAGRGATG